jgi:hypothetical protein
MTKKIEFIEKEMEYTKKKLERLEIDLNFPFRKDVITHLKENLQTLEQIKSDLEAWDVVKGRLRKEKKTGAYIYMNSIAKCHPSYRTVDKALEVENE